MFYCRQATPLTIFAPTDAAFAKLPQSVLDQLSTDPQALADTLKFHVTSGIVISPMIQDGSEFTSLSGKNLTAHRYANQVEILFSNVNVIIICFCLKSMYWFDFFDWLI